MSKRKAVILAICITAIVSSGLTNLVNGISNSVKYGGVLSKISTISRIADKYFIDEIDYKKAADYAAYALTASLDDPYTQYFDAETFARYMDDNNGVFVGVGIVVAPNTEDNTIEIISPYEDSPAEKAGIMAGDVIVSANGMECNAGNYNDVVEAMQGKEGESLTLMIKRDEGEPFSVTMVREQIIDIAVKSRMLENNIGYIRISDFDIGIQEDFKNQFNELENQGMKKLIIDLRNNPGGDAGAVYSIADYMLPEGVIMYTMDKYGNKEYAKSTQEPIGADGRAETDNTSMEIPVAVLVNEGSASASEVLAGSLQCYDRATIIGNTTYGKGVIQAVLPFKDGSGMKITYGKYYFSNDKCIHGEGVIPDIIVDLPEGINKTVAQLTDEEDTQLAKAIEILSEK